MRIITYFDESTWDQFGQSWRRPNIQVLDPIIIYSDGMSGQLRKEITDFFSTKHTTADKFDEVCFFLLDKVLEEGKSYLLVSPECLPPFSVTTNSDAFCRLKNDLSKGQKIDSTMSMPNISNRVEVVRILESISERLGGLLDSSFIFGTFDFWVSFIGFQKYLRDSGFLTCSNSYYRDLVLNLFYNSSSSFSMEVEK